MEQQDRAEPVAPESVEGRDVAEATTGLGSRRGQRRRHAASLARNGLTCLRPVGEEAFDTLMAEGRARPLEAAIEEAALEFLRQHVGAKLSPMCGNSICQDRRFLARWMPKLEAFFLYRNLDVSTLKELVKRWKPAIAAGLVAYLALFAV